MDGAIGRQQRMQIGGERASRVITSLWLLLVFDPQPRHQPVQQWLCAGNDPARRHLGAAPAGDQGIWLQAKMFGQDAPPVGSVAPVGRRAFRHAQKMRIDRLVHTVLDDRGQGFTGERPIVLAPFEPIRLHGLHHRERCW